MKNENGMTTVIAAGWLLLQSKKKIKTKFILLLSLTYIIYCQTKTLWVLILTSIKQQGKRRGSTSTEHKANATSFLCYTDKRRWRRKEVAVDGEERGTPTCLCSLLITLVGWLLGMLILIAYYLADDNYESQLKCHHKCHLIIEIRISSW
jgi:hypothetical protein